MEIIFKPVDVYHYTSKEEFIDYTNNHRKPLLIRGLDIGPCKTKWTVQYLAERIQKVPVSVHISPTGKMSFLKKNFTYMKLPFDEFLFRASGEAYSKEDSLKPILCENEVLYYRSISFDKRGKECADLSKHFPQISSDFYMPDVFESHDFFSSVFRIASPNVQVWTHYDIMDNILIQISGTKRVVLFSPSDIEFMYMNGDKSEVVDIDNPDITKYPLFPQALQHECILEPGDAVFIPALWLHNVCSKTFSIGVNVFWKNLPHELYEKNDTYGNKDLIPATKAFLHIKKAIESLGTLPIDYRKFYIRRCIEDLKRSLGEMKFSKDVEGKKEGNTSKEKPSESEATSSCENSQGDIV